MFLFFLIVMECSLGEVAYLQQGLVCFESLTEGKGKSPWNSLSICTGLSHGGKGEQAT